MTSNWDWDVFYLGTPAVSLRANNYVISVDPATETGSGEIPMTVITLDANNGQFITQSNGGVTPIINQFDILQVTFLDENGIATMRQYFVDNRIPRLNDQEGLRLELHCLGREKWVDQIHFAKQFYFSDAFGTVKDIANKYNANKGSLQPAITKHDDANFNQLPQWTSTIYDFNSKETLCYSGMIEVLDRLGASPSSPGGGGDFFELRFDIGAGSSLEMHAFSSGSTRKVGSIVTISSTLAVNLPESQAGLESQQGTLVIEWGSDVDGSFPTDFSKFRGIDELWYLYPTFVSGQTYPAGAIVYYDNGTGLKHFKALVQTTNNPNTADWTQIFEYDLLGTTSYSPWTLNAAAYWKNSAGDPLNKLVGNPGPACWDANQVIQDGTYYRTFADTRSNNGVTCGSGYTMTSKQILDNGGPPAKRFYRGFRILVDTNMGPVSGIFASNPFVANSDRFGVSYGNAIVMNNGSGFEDYRAWDVIVGAPTTSIPVNSSAIKLKDNYQVSIRDESRVYKYIAGLLSWTDNHSVSKGNDCWHPYLSITQGQGISTIAKNGGGTYGDNSALVFKYQWVPFYGGFLATLITTNNNYYSCGAWANLAFPIPITSDGLAIDPGSIFGGSGKSNPPEPATLDNINMHLTHKGNSGFNFAESDDYGPLSSLSFDIKMVLQDQFGTLLTLFGTTWANFKMRCALYDTNDNVVVQDFTVAFNNMWQAVQLPLQDFQIYRARIPLMWGDINALVPPPQLNVLNVFGWHNIKQIVIQFQDVYDDQGRFKPETSLFNTWVTGSIPFNVFSPVSAQLLMYLDAVRFVKPLLVTTGPVSNYCIEPEPRNQRNITNYQQLKNDAIANSNIIGWPHTEYEITTTLKCDIAFGDSFYYNDPYMVPFSDDGIPHNVKLVAKRVSYYVNKTGVGPGGGHRTILGVRRYPTT